MYRLYPYLSRRTKRYRGAPLSIVPQKGYTPFWVKGSGSPPQRRFAMAEILIDLLVGFVASVLAAMFVRLFDK